MNAELQSDILQRIQARREAIIAFTQALLRIPTANTPPSGNEKPAQAFLAEKLASLGLEVALFCLDEVPGLTSHPAYRVGGSVEIARDYRDRPDLVGVWRGRGGGPSLIVASHVDVVPPGDPAQWRYDPWSGTRGEGRIYGRGAIDAKGPLAAAVMAMACLREMGLALGGDLIFQSFVDEEYGGGNGALATILHGYRADGALMLEPTDLVVCPATYGCQSFKIAVHGQGAHPIERWQGVDAIGLALRVYQSLQELEALRGRSAQSLPLFGEREIPAPLIVRRFESQTLGGGAVPDLCEMQAWMTTLPGESQASLLAQVSEHLAASLSDSAWLKTHRPAIRTMGRFLEATSLPVEAPLVKAARSAQQRVLGETRIGVGTSGDGFIYANYGGMPLVEMGPGPIHRAHAPNEHITEQELLDAVALIALTIVEWCGVA